MKQTDLPFQDQKVWDYLSWNSFVSEKYKLFYVSTPKVACTSLKWWFADLVGATEALRSFPESAESDPDLVIHDTFFKVAPDVTGLSPEILIEAIQSSNFFRFAVVRNPYKRIFSAWQSKLLLREPLQIEAYLNCDFFNSPIENLSDIVQAFEDFLEHVADHELPDYKDVHWAPQVSLLRPDLIPYSEIARIEDVDDLEIALKNHLGKEGPSPFSKYHVNESLMPFLPDFITKRSADLIQMVYAEDFENFRYSTRVPEVKETFSKTQLDVALKAVNLIRARHQRLKDMRGWLTGEIARQTAEIEQTELVWQGQIKKLQGKLIDRNEQINRLQGDLSDRDEQINRLQGDLSGRDEQINQLQIESLTQNEQITFLQQDLAEKVLRFNDIEVKYRQLINSPTWRIAARLTTTARRIPGIPLFIDKTKFFLSHWSTWKQKKVIRQSGLFDERYYIENNPDVARQKLDPLAHFLVHGGYEGCRPNPTFDPAFYWAHYPDASLSGMNPLLHYIIHGRKQGRLTQEVMRPPRDNHEMEQRYLSGQTVLFVGHDASQTGAPKVLLDLVQWFRDHTALDIRLVLINGGVWQDRFRDIAETLILSELQDLPAEEVTKKLYDFAGSKVKCVYLNTVASAPFLSFWKREDVPLFAHIHEMRESVDRLFPNEIGQMAARVKNYIAVSPPVLDGLMQLTDTEEESIIIVYPFITPADTLLPAVDDKKSIRNTLGLPADKFIVIGCGVIYARKGVDLFLECAKKVIEAGDEQPLFVWIGGGYGVGDRPAMQQLAEKFGIAEQVIFTGPVDDPRRYFQAGDLFLMTSREDPFPLVCLEAAERGIPVICFADAGGMPLFVEEDAGFVVPYLDTDLMADKVIRLQGDNRLRQRLGGCGRRKVFEKYTVGNAGLEILAYLRREAGIKPAVSVIVPNYNHFPYLPERLDSIYNQSFQDIEVILLDDASTDNSIDILDSYQKKYPYISTVMYNAVNSTSVFKQWVKGINRAKGDLVWIAESDDFCAEGFLHRMLPQMADQAVMLGYCQSYCLHGEKDAALTYVDMGYYDNLDRARWQKNYICSGTEEITRFMVVKNIIPNVSSTIIRNIGIKNILPELSSYKISGDWVFYLRQIEGGKISYLAQPLNYHRVHVESVVRSNRNKILFQEFEQVHRMVSSRYTLDRDIKDKMISYVTDTVYATFGKNLDLALEAVYNCKSVQESQPPGNYEGKSPAVSLQTDLKPIAFYLPQFHAIPENDQWWGKGFTEWTNTRQGTPLFTNHFQPRIPHEDIGYYDLRDWRVIKKQALLARQYGIHGFCFYHYWFGGKRLLEKPVNNFLDHPEIEFPFCLCWANENWTRCWDGKDSEILLAQNHSAADDISFIEDLSRYLKDSRYIRIQDKPLVLIYRPELFPEPEATSNRWRQWCRKNGIGEIYLAYMDAFTNPDNPQDINFDAKIEFPPNTGLYSEVLVTPKDMDDEFNGWILSYPAYVRQLILNRKRKTSDYPLFRTVMLAWDNTARRKMAGTVFADFSTRIYREWLQDTIAHTRAELTDNQRFFFINAWNEWAEGTYLEPDTRLGYACLNVTLEELQRNS